MHYPGPKPLYQTDEDAKRIQTVLDRRTEQLMRAHGRTFALGVVAVVLLGLLIGVVA